MKLEDLIVAKQQTSPKNTKSKKRALVRKGDTEKEEFNAMKYAEALLQCGLVQSRAYIQAFGETKTAYQRSCAYAKRPEVKAAVRKVLATYKEHAASGPEKTNGILWNQVHANILDFFDDDGVMMIKELKELPLGLQRCVKKLHVFRTTTPEGQVSERVSVELYDKHEAMNLLGKIGKWFADNEDDGSKVSIAEVIANAMHAVELKKTLLEGECKVIEHD